MRLVRLCEVLYLCASVFICGSNPLDRQQPKENHIN